MERRAGNGCLDGSPPLCQRKKSSTNCCAMEAMINRQLNHAIAELERVQARRKGGIHRGLVLRNKATKLFSFNRARTLQGRTKPNLYLDSEWGEGSSRSCCPENKRPGDARSALPVPPQPVSAASATHPVKLVSNPALRKGLHRMPKLSLAKLSTVYRLIPLTGAPFKGRILVLWWERFGRGAHYWQACGFLTHRSIISDELSFYPSAWRRQQTLAGGGF
jgi:hypothetical protein